MKKKSLSNHQRIHRTRIILGIIIAATIPCYCSGLIILNNYPKQQITPTITASMESTETIQTQDTPTLESITPSASTTFTATISPTAKWTASMTYTPFMSPTVTITPTPSFTPTFTPSLTATFTEVPPNTETSTQTTIPANTATFTATVIPTKEETP